MSILLADIDATAAALGYFDGEKYHAEPDAIQGLKHLIWILRRDIENHEYRRHLGRAKVVQTDLVPMLPEHIDDEEYSDVLIRLLVILTNPTLLLYRDGLPKDGAGSKIYFELIEILQGYKGAFTSDRIWAALATKLHQALDTDWAIRSEEQGLVIERILVLVRNVLQVPANPELECRADNDASLHDQVIWALQQSGMLDLVLYTLSSADENQYHLHALEIVCLLFREQTAASLADASLQRSAAEKHRDEEELIAVRRREKQKLIARPPPGRHSRFGGTYVLQNVKSVSDKDIICHQSLERAVSIDFDREKNKMKRSHRIVKEAGRTERRSAFSVRLCLREYCIEVLRSAYNTLVRQVRRVLERNSGTGSGHDDSYLLWAIRFFMEFNRLSGMQLDLVGEALSVQCFHWVLTRIQHDLDMIMCDKKQAQLWSRRVHVGIQTFRELLLSLVALQRLTDEKAQALFKMLQNNVCYVLEYRETVLQLLIGFNESHSTKVYLRDVIETANIFIKLMEKFCQDPVVVQEKSRQRKKGGSKKSKSKRPENPNELTNENLEDMWSSIVSEVSTLLASTDEVNLPENEELPIPFDAASDKAIDDQKEDCMLRIHKFLREEKLEHAIILMRSAREVWPENDCFGAFSSAPEDDLLLLREIYFSKISSVEKAPQNDESDEDESGDDEDDENDEERDEPRRVEKDFRFDDFAKRLINPKIVRACTIVLSDWETMPTKSLKSTVTILHRIAYGCKCPAMLYQAVLFKIFQEVFNAPRDKHHEELRRLGVYVVRRFVEMAPKNPKIFAELLFYKTIREANELETGYADNYHTGTKGAWTEEQENELRTLFLENQNNPENDQDVIDWILDNLIDNTRTRRGVLKKLKELGLVFKAPTKKSSAAAANKNLWQHEEDEELRNFYDENRLENDCLARLMEAFGKQRNKNNIIKRMIQLGLIADRSEIIPKRVKKSQTKKSQSELNRPNTGKQLSRKKKSKKVMNTPLDIASVKFLVCQAEEELKEAVDWLKECLTDAAEDFDEPSDDNDDGVPILPLQEIEKKAMEDECFKKLLISLGIQPPIEATENYWKIPVYLSAADLKMRAQVLAGTYVDVEDNENAFAAQRDGDMSSSDDDDSDGEDDDDEKQSLSENEDNDDSDSHAKFLSKRREQFDDLVFNQSDNEDEHRAPLKRNKKTKAKTIIEKEKNEKTTKKVQKSSSGGRARKINVNDMIMEQGTDDEANNDPDDNMLDDFDSENLRLRLAELTDDDNDDDGDDADNNKDEKGTSQSGKEGKTTVTRTSRIRRNVIDSDSSDDDDVINNVVDKHGNNDPSIFPKGGDRKEVDDNGDTGDDVRQHTLANNQSSLVESPTTAREIDEVPTNSLRVSPTPDDADLFVNSELKGNKKRSRQADDSAESDDDDEEVVVKKKRSDTGDNRRRWAAIIDEDDSD